MNEKQVARGLGWFGIGLGLAEVLAPRGVARAAGLGRHHRLIRLFGVREILSGIPLLVADDPQPWLWLRVAGDGLDSAVLTAGMAPSNPRRGRALMAALAVAPVVALDLIYALRRGPAPDGHAFRVR